MILDNIIKMNNKNVNKYIKTLKDYFGFDNFKSDQLKIIEAVLEGKDVCAIMFTGAGKSLCYQFPPVYLNKTSIVICPLLSLANDQAYKMNKLGIPVCCFNHTVVNKMELKNEILKNKYRLVYLTPEYLITQQTFLQEFYETGYLLSINIDEAHCISSMGSDFRPSYMQLCCIKEWLPDITVLALTATATPKVQQDMIKSLQLQKPLIIKTTFDRPNLYIKVIKKSDKPLDDLLSILKNSKSSIVYCQTRAMTDKLTDLLKRHNINCDSYHAGMPTNERIRVHDEFVKLKITCVIATIAFGMGIDATIRTVIHYGMPSDMESYYQEMGRAGRDGLKSHCYLFYALSDFNHNDYLVNQISNVAYRHHKMEISLMMKNYIYSNECRRKYILKYFNEDYKNFNCGNCDNCCSPKQITQRDFTNEAIQLLQVTNDTGNVYGATMLINVLRGSTAKKIPKNFMKLSTYGKGSNHDDKWWKIFVRMLINTGYIREKSISGGHGCSLIRTKEGTTILNSMLTGQKLLLNVPSDMVNPNINNNDNDNDNDNDNKKIKNINNTIETTYDMFNNKNMSIDQISIERKLKKQTVEEHLVKIYDENKKELNIKNLGFTKETYNKISNKIKELDNPSELKIIKNALKNTSYLQIKLTLIKMQRHQRINKIIKDINNPTKMNKELDIKFNNIMTTIKYKSPKIYEDINEYEDIYEYEDVLIV